MLSSLGAILAVILVSTSVGNEYSWRTIRTMLISSESRFKLLTAKLVTVAEFIFIGMVVGVAVGFAMSLLTTWIGGYAFDFSFFTRTYAWDQFLQFWRTYFVLLPFVTMAFMFSIVGKSAMPGIAFGVGFLFLEPMLIVPLMRQAGGWIAKVPNYLFSANVEVIRAMANLPQGLRGGMEAGVFGGTDKYAPTVGHAFLILSIYVVVFLIIGYYLFRKRDVTG
jgi:ABC-2 type transport system permease protein